MKPLSLTLFAFGLAATVTAQSLDPAHLEDLVTVEPSSKEVVVDLRNATDESAPPPVAKPVLAPDEPNAKPASQGPPPASAGPAAPTPVPAPPATAEASPTATQAPNPEGPTGVTAEVTGVSGERVANLDPSKVKIRAPFPAKPLASPPAGWQIARPKNSKSITRDVELAPGKRLTLRIQPHVLIPDADGVEVFAVAEPGYDPAAFYQQTSTVAGILGQSVEQSTIAERRLTLAIDRLDQLLLSLPNPDKR